ncbi:hypothetical protein F4810DRAFT_652682 [Camillea tinctor]|nr:hypothetical protein F4810DRAFT_652682 [Camillea tinctor]
MHNSGEDSPFLGEYQNESKNSAPHPLPTQSKWRTLLSGSLILNAILLLLVIPSLSWTLSRRSHQECSCSTSTHDSQNVMNGDIKKTSAYSPLLDQVDFNVHFERFNGRIHDNTTIYRMDPSPEVDAAWDRLSAEGFEIITVGEEDVILTGKTPGLSVKAPSSWGLGDKAYVAQVDVFHQIHCLNELRKEIHFDYYYSQDGALNHSSLPPEHMEHKKHCIHMLLQNLMCHADVEIITHNWVHYDIADQPNRPFAEPFADFNVIKKCRDFDALLEWAEENAVHDLKHKWAELKLPEGTQFVQGDGYF